MRIRQWFLKVDYNIHSFIYKADIISPTNMLSVRLKISSKTTGAKICSFDNIALLSIIVDMNMLIHHNDIL